MRYLTGKFERKPKKQSLPSPGAQYRPIKDSNSSDSGEDLFRSELYPDNLPLRRPTIARRVGLILVILAFVASSWFCFLGPGSSILETNLRKLAVQAKVPPVFTFTPSELADLTPSPHEDEPSPTPTRSTLTITATRTQTSTVTETATATIEPSPTPVPIQQTPTPTSEVAGCVPASLVTLGDVGKNICVSGRVFRTIDKASSFIIVVVEEPQAFYFVAYDLKYENLEKQQCIFATGEIRQLGSNPIMVLSYATPLQYCP
jgi:hypothetical protein